MTKRILPGAAFMAVVAAGALFGVSVKRAGGTSATPPSATRDAGGTTRPEGPGDAPVVAWPRFVSQVYDLDLRTKATAGAMPALVDLHLEGTLTLTLVGDADERVIRGQFSGQVTGFGGTAATVGDGSHPSSADQVLDAFRRSVEAPFYWVYSASGEFKGIRADRDAVPLAAQLWRSVGAFAQLRRPASAPAAWSLSEPDASGTYVAQHELSRAGAETRIRKTKERYVGGDARTAATFLVTRSTADFVLDAEAHLASLQVDEALQVDFPAHLMPSTRVATTLSARRSATEPAQVTLSRGGSPYESLVFFEPEKEARASGGRQIDRAKIGNWTLDAILPALREADLAAGKRKLSREEKERAGRAYMALAALLREQPDQIAAVRDHVAANGALADTMIAALRDAGTPQAQQALRELLQLPSLPVERRMEVARGLSRVGEPTADTVAALQALQADPVLGTQATYGLGSNLHRLLDGQPELAADVRRQLVSQLQGASLGDQKILLTALGNAGDPLTVGAVAPFLGSPSDEVRAAAAQAVRRVPGPDADALLARACADPSAGVRYSAVDALSERAPGATGAAALEALLANEPEFRVRARAVQLATRWIGAAPGLAVALTAIASRDPSEDLRRIALAALTATTPMR